MIQLVKSATLTKYNQILIHSNSESAADFQFHTKLQWYKAKETGTGDLLVFLM